MNEERFEHFICFHVFNRIKVYLYDAQGDEDYTLDMPEEVFDKMLEIMNKFKNGIYEPSETYKVGE